MVRRNDTYTERRKEREGASFVSVEWSKKTTRIQRAEEEEKASTLYP